MISIADIEAARSRIDGLLDRLPLDIKDGA